MAEKKPQVLPDGRVATGIPGQFLTPEELYENRSGRTTVAVAFGIALPVFAVTLRLIARGIRGLKLGPDDYMILVAMVLTIANSCVPIISNKGGNGRHQVTVSKHELQTFFLALFIFEQTFGAAICAVKLSVLLLYRRIFATPSFRIWTTVIGALTVMWLLVKNLVGAFQCNPVRKAWIKDTPGHCPVNFIHNVLGAQAFNTFFDIVIMVMPIWQIYKLHLPLRKRIGVMAIFAVGTFTIVVSLLRLGIIAAEVTTYGPTLPDVTWFTDKFSWTIMDPAVGCFVACMPTWAPLAKPIKKIPGYFASVRMLLTRGTVSGSRGTSSIHGEQSSQVGFVLANYKGARTRTWIRKVDSTASDVPAKPEPNRVEVRRDFTQEEHRADSAGSFAWA